VAVGTGIYWSTRETQLDHCHDPRPATGARNESTLKTLRNVAMGMTIGVGAAALTMAAIGILSWNSRPAARPTQSALDCIVSPLGLLAAGHSDPRLFHATLESGPRQLCPGQGRPGRGQGSGQLHDEQGSQHAHQNCFYDR